jgi:excisionase family DNA binding protein
MGIISIIDGPGLSRLILVAKSGHCDYNRSKEHSLEKEATHMTPPSEPREWLTPEEVSARIKVSEQTVRRWIREGKIIASQLGRALRIDVADLDAFMEETKLQPVREANAQDMIDPEEAARRLGVSSVTLRRWLRIGTISGKQVGGANGRWMVAADVVEAHRQKRMNG